jgi:hypothetical protein
MTKKYFQADLTIIIWCDGTFKQNTLWYFAVIENTDRHKIETIRRIFVQTPKNSDSKSPSYP